MADSGVDSNESNEEHHPPPNSPVDEEPEEPEPPPNTPFPGHFGHEPMSSVTEGSNSCTTVVKFQFPGTSDAKLFYHFDPSLPSNFERRNIFSEIFTAKAVPNKSNFQTPVVSNCLTIIPYEQRELHHKDRCYRRRFYKTTELPSSAATARKQFREKRLRLSASLGDLQMLGSVLSREVNVNAADELGRTALHIAACKGFSDVVGLLLSSGANPNQKDSVGNTPLHLAACTNHFEVVTCLLRAGTDIHQLDNHGRNPLQLAQSKLKLLAREESRPDIKLKVQEIIEMMIVYFNRTGQDNDATEALNELASKLTLSSTDNEDVKNLLDNLANLSLSSRK